MNIAWLRLAAVSVAASFLLPKNRPARNRNVLQLPSFYQVLEIKSAVPGRIRFQSPHCRGDAALLRQAAAQLAKITGVERVEVNPITGSLLLCYAPEALAPQLLEAAVMKLLGLDGQAQVKPQSLFKQEMRTLHEAFDQTLLTKTKGVLDARDFVALVLTALGGWQIAANPARLPTGYTLLWWGLNQAFSGRAE